MSKWLSWLLIIAPLVTTAISLGLVLSYAPQYTLLQVPFASWFVLFLNGLALALSGAAFLFWQHFASAEGKKEREVNMSNQRPASIIIIVILQILDGLWGLLSGCALLVGGGALGALIAALVKETAPWLGGALGGLIALVGAVLVALALLDLLLAWGVWKLYRWAWWVTLIKAILSIAGPLFTLLGGNLTSIPTLVLNGVIILLLLTDEVRQVMGIR